LYCTIKVQIPDSFGWHTLLQLYFVDFSGRKTFQASVIWFVFFPRSGMIHWWWVVRSKEHSVACNTSVLRTNQNTTKIIISVCRYCQVWPPELGSLLVISAPSWGRSFHPDPSDFSSWVSHVQNFTALLLVICPFFIFNFSPLVQYNCLINHSLSELAFYWFIIISHSNNIYIYIYSYGALQSTRTLCVLRFIINFKLEIIDPNCSI
jgi:hypothetical protein